MANVLSVEKQKLCLKMLAEGSSIRAVERTADVHRDTVMRLMVKFGTACSAFLDVELRDLKCRHLEIDEQWTWVSKKQGKLTDDEKQNRNVGDQYLYLALDQDSKLIAYHRIGKRDEINTRAFIAQLATRIVLPPLGSPMDERPQLSTDGWQSYPGAILDTFGSRVQYGQVIKAFAGEQTGRYAPPEVVATERRRVQFIENLYTICTSHAERFNCTTRQFVKRFCRLTLAFSKKLDNLKAAVAMHIANYNYCWRPRENGKSGKLRPTPAMMAGVCGSLWSFDDLYENVMG